MKDLFRQDLRKFMIRSLAALGLTAGGIVIGGALALAVAEALGQACAQDRVCQVAVYGLLAGMALTQALNLIVIFWLLRRLHRRKR